MSSTLRAPRKLRTAISVVASLMLVLAMAGGVAAADDGSGTMTVNTTTAAGGVGDQAFTFDFTNVHNDDFAASSQVVLTIPAGWTLPQNANAANPGYVTVVEGSYSGANTCDPGTVVFGGTGPWTITIPQTCGHDDHLTITYGNVKPPVTAGQPQAYPFTTQTRDGAESLTSIQTSPIITVDTLAITFYKEVCPRYSDVPANRSPESSDATGGHSADLDTRYPTEASPADRPAACAPASGWSFQLLRGNNGTLIQTVTTGNDGSYTVYLGSTDIAWARGGGVWVNEVLSPAVAGFGALRCYRDVLNGDNLDYVGGVPTGTNQAYCLSYNVRQIITFDPLGNQIYGAGPITLGATATSNLPVSYDASGSCTLGGNSLTLTGVGSCTVTAHQVGQDSPFWSAADDVSRTFVIGQATATCTVTPYNVTFDGVAHTATGSCTGIGDMALSGLVLTGTTHTNAADYATDAWTFSNADYASQNGTVHDVIGQATATCTVTPYNVTFDGVAHTATGFCTPVVAAAPNGADPAQVQSLTGLDLSLTAHTAAGDYPEDPWTFTNGNYLPKSGTVHDVITALPTLTITADNKTRVFGAADPAFTYVVSPSVSLTTPATCTTTADASSAVGTYPITCTGAALAGYNVGYVAGTLTVTALPTLTITTDNQSRVFGEMDPVFTYVVSPSVGLDTPPTCTTTAVVLSPAGTYPISCTDATAAGYNVGYVPGTLTITALPILTITADNKTRVVGAADPAFTFVVSPSVSLIAPATCTSTAIASSPAGTYPISCTGAVVAGYTISYVAGTLTITGIEIVEGATAAPTVAPTAAPTVAPSEQVAAVTASPVRAVTPPPTSSNDNSSNSGSLPLMLILIALAFGGLGMLAVQAQRRTIRR